MEIVWLTGGFAFVVPVVWLCISFAFKKRLLMHRGQLVRQLRTTEELARATQYKLNMTRDLVDKMEARQGPILDELAVMRAELAAIEEEECSGQREAPHVQEHLRAAEAACATAEAARDASVAQTVKLNGKLRAIELQLQNSKDAQALTLKKLNDLEAANKDLLGKLDGAEHHAKELQLRIKKDEAEHALVSKETRDRISNLQEIVSQRDRQIKRLRADVTASKSTAGNTDAHAPDRPDELSAPHLALVSDGDAADTSSAPEQDRDRSAVGA